MKRRIPIILLTLAGFSFGCNTPAEAIGCISGGVAGAVAGHLVHHGVLGAFGGCIAGHEYNKHQKEQAAQQPANDANQPPGTHGGQEYGTEGQTR